MKEEDPDMEKEDENDFYLQLDPSKADEARKASMVNVKIDDDDSTDHDATDDNATLIRKRLMICDFYQLRL